MRLLIAAAALVTLAAAPALAASHTHRTANDAYAYAYGGDPTMVTINGKIVGRDPDLAIRTQLLREGDQTAVNGD